MTEDKNAVFPVASIRVCLDQAGSLYQGFICGITLENELTFTGKTELIRVIEEAYDAIGRPQPQLVARSFTENKVYDRYVGNPTKYHTSEEIHEKHGQAATYDMVMVSRKYAEWQGVWKEIDGSLRARFETMLECIGQI